MRKTYQNWIKFELILISNNWIRVAINLISNWYKKLDQNRIKFFDPVLISFLYQFDIKMDSTMDQNFCSCFDLKYDAILISKWEQIWSSIDIKLLMRKTFLNRNKFISRIKIGSNEFLVSKWYQNWIKSGKNVAWEGAGV